MQLELPAFKRLAQIAFESGTGGDCILHLLVEKAQGVATCLFGLVHGDVGLFQQLVF